MPAPVFTLSDLSQDDANLLIFALENAPLSIAKGTPLLAKVVNDLKVQADKINAANKPSPEPAPPVAEVALPEIATPE